MLALLGPNGAGKTTLVSALTGVLRPTAGHIAVKGANPQRAQTRARLGVVHQIAGFPRTLRVGELVSGWAVRARVPAAAAAAAMAMAEVGLDDLAGRRVDRLSGGLQQRLQLAMALVVDPALLVLDEPTLGLDVDTRRNFWRTMPTAATVASPCCSPHTRSRRPRLWPIACAPTEEAAQGRLLFEVGKLFEKGQVRAARGRQLADNLTAVVAGGQPQPFRYEMLGETLTLGRYDGVAQIRHRHLRGRLQRYLRRLYHTARIPSLRRRVHVWADWTLRVLTGREIVSLGELRRPNLPLERAANAQTDV